VGNWKLRRRVTSQCLTPSQKEELARLVEAGHDPAVNAVVRWRCLDLKAEIRRRFGVDYHERSVGKLLSELGFSHVSVRPRHVGQKAEPIEDFKKTSPGRWLRR
jgi:transposase